MPNWFTSSTTKDAIDSLNKVAQIIALIIAGYWGYHIYQQTSKPGLETRSDVDVDVDWSAEPNSDFCLGSFTVTVKNNGITPFDLTRYSIRAVVFSNSSLIKTVPPKQAGQPAFVNYDEVAKGNAFYEEDHGEASGLNGHYPSGEARNLSWDFIFKKDSDKSVYFSITPEIDRTPHDVSWKADAVCPSAKLETKNKETNAKEK